MQGPRGVPRNETADALAQRGARAECACDVPLRASRARAYGLLLRFVLQQPVSLTTAKVHSEHHECLQTAFKKLAEASGARYDVDAAPSDSTSRSDGFKHHHSGAIVFPSIRAMIKAVDILMSNGIDIVMASGAEETLTPFRIDDRITKPEATGHRYVLVSAMVLNTGGFVVDVELHLAAIAAIRPEQRRNESKYDAMKKKRKTSTTRAPFLRNSAKVVPKA